MNQSKATRNKHTLLERTAYHEAGHAVVYHYLRLALQGISIVRTDDSLGACLGNKKPLLGMLTRLNDGYNDLKTRAYLEHHIQAAFAGQAAEWLLTGRRSSKYCQDDLNCAVNLSTSLEGSSEAALLLLKLLRVRTECLLKNRWREVEALGLALLERKTLTGKQAREIIRAQNEMSSAKLIKIMAELH
jgi:ATP-dependent Zn protease